MKKHPRIDINKVKTYPMSELSRKVEADFLGRSFEPGEEFARYIDSLPEILKAADLRDFSRIWAEAVKKGGEVILMMGAHPIKVGLSPIMIDLVDRGFITGIAGNGAVAIHDCEMALFGRTSEEVIEGLADGSFGMARETGDFLNEAAKFAQANDLGFGEALGERLEEASPDFAGLSLILACRRKGIPLTVHVGVGTDITHQHPSCDGAAVGAASYNDFKILSQLVTKLSDGMVINLGSAVVLPEVFLKALTIARNLGHDVKGFAAANFDMIQHYRPNTNVLDRPTAIGGGRKFSFTGHHEVMFPLVAAMVKMEERYKISGFCLKCSKPSNKY